MKQTFLDSAKRCTENGQRLLDEAEFLQCEQPPATQFYLSMIAQEECAKAFLLYLVSADVFPWTPFLLRATRDHQCKQLVGIVLDFLTPDIDKFLSRMNSAIQEGKRLDFPASVADAMNILRHEKIGRWESSTWGWAEDPDYDNTAVRVAEGKRDREKQRALYVELGRNGQVSATPERVTKAQADEEFERARRFKSFLDDLIDQGAPPSLDYEWVENCCRALFSEPGALVES